MLKVVENLGKHLFIWYRLCFNASGILSAIESDLWSVVGDEEEAISFGTETTRRDQTFPQGDWNDWDEVVFAETWCDNHKVYIGYVELMNMLWKGTG